jgi:hypothetical protein
MECKERLLQRPREEKLAGKIKKDDTVYLNGVSS